MATTDILLLKPIEKLGNEGDHVQVKAGFARNYLFPKMMAVPVNHANRKQIGALVKRREERLTNELSTAQEIAKKIENLHIAIAMKTGPGGKLFGSVTAQYLHEQLTAHDVKIDRKQIALSSPVKSLGKHNAKIKVHAELSVDLEFEVVSENPIDKES